MKTRHLRIAAATALAAVAIGVAAPAANAADHTRTSAASTAPVTLTAPQARAVLASPELRPHLDATDRTLLRAVADGNATPELQRGAASSAAKAALAALKKAGGKLWSGAKSAAAKGYPAFKQWLDGLPWYHPVRIAIAALGGEGIKQLIDLINNS
ncbi:hypothetical protein GCM10020229_42840 [Kitasatospora albolonga]|uniref:hypothetical protein n=1 Tax=Kitasatospora albolonga TaxID=68173 RepID=UPI0031E7F263